MKSNKFLYTLLIANLLLIFSILYACRPYPPCEQSCNCFLLGENQKLKIPVILPITSTNILLSQEYQKAVDLALKENIWMSENVELSFIDNFDDSQKNIDFLSAFLEPKDTPIIFNFLSSQKNQEINNLHYKTGKIIVSANNVQIDEISINSFFPDEETLKKQATDLISDYVYAKELIVFSDFDTIQNDIVNLCDQNNVNCYQFASTNPDLIDKISNQKTIPVAIISQKPLILEWLADNYFLLNNPILIFDTSFSNPVDFQTLYNDINWIGPDIWFETSTGSSSNYDSNLPVKWGYLETSLAFRQLNNIFQALEMQLSNSHNGFRQFDTTLFIQQFTKISPLQEIMIHNYQLQNNQFIMINEPALE